MRGGVELEKQGSLELRIYVKAVMSQAVGLQVLNAAKERRFI